MRSSQETSRDAKRQVEVLKFKIDKKLYAINIELVQEILQVEKISETPNSNNSIAGLSMIRGDTVVVVDLRFVTEKRISEKLKSNTTLLCEIQGMRCALLVDEVVGIQRVNMDQIVQPDIFLKSSLISSLIMMEDEIAIELDYIQSLFDFDVTQ